MGFVENVRNFFGVAPENEEYADYSEEETEQEIEEQAVEYGVPRGNAVTMKGTKSRGRIVVKTPENFEDGKAIADLLKQRNSIVFNLEQLSREEGSRLIDFLMGASYMSDAELKYTGNMTFLLAPKDVDVVVQATRGEPDDGDFFS